MLRNGRATTKTGVGCFIQKVKDLTGQRKHLRKYNGRKEQPTYIRRKTSTLSLKIIH